MSNPNKKPQHVERKDSEHMKDLRVWDYDSKPSWKTYGEGSAEFRAYAHNVGEWLQLSLAEHAAGGARAMSRQTMLALDKPAAQALRDLLNETFGEPGVLTAKEAAEFTALRHLREELRTHIDSFRTGLTAAKTCADAHGKGDDAAYWQHEIDALADIAKAVQDAS